MTELRTLKVALLGCGNVGAQVARILIEDADTLAARTGARLQLSGIAVRNVNAKRDVDLPQELFTTDADTLVKDADLVIELMGGIEPARTLIISALRNGACVVTGNKALLAQDGPTLYEEADKAGVQLSYEAAVAGAIDGRRFRMLFEIDGVPQHEEDEWLGTQVSIGDATIVLNGDVGRCVVTSPSTPDAWTLPG